MLVHEGPGELRAIELIRESATAEAPALTWRHPKREAPMDLVFEPGDEVTAWEGAGEASDEAPTYLHAKLGLIDLVETDVQVRDFRLSFQFGGEKFEYVGQLSRTPWREAPVADE